jgi:hypothetical protein
MSCASHAHPLQALEEEARAAKEKEKELMTGNPLLAIAGDVSFNLKRRSVTCLTGHALLLPGSAGEQGQEYWVALNPAHMLGKFTSHVVEHPGLPLFLHTRLLVLSMMSAAGFLHRWDEDVVFKNQARGEPKATKRFVNDTIRNDFHKRFLQRYIR